MDSPPDSPHEDKSAERVMIPQNPHKGMKQLSGVSYDFFTLATF